MKKLLALLVAAVLISAVFTSCASEKEPPSVTTTQAPVSDVNSAEETTEAPLPETEPALATTKADKAEETKAPEKEKPTTPPATANVKVSKDEAKEIALNHAKLQSSDISQYSIELDKERGSLIYEIEFNHGGYEYDYEINADSGKIIKSQKEFDR